MQYTKFLRWGTLALLSLTFLIPFIVADGSFFPNMFFPFITGKAFAFRILVELLLGFYVLLALREPKYRPRASVLMWALVGFVAWVGIATLLSVDPIKSFWSNFERMEGYITILHLFVYCVVLGAVVSAEKWWNNLLRIAVGASAIEGIISLMQVVHLFGFAPSSQSGARADGTFGNAEYLAVYMLMNVFLTLFMLIRERKSAQAQILYGIALVLQVATIFFTETRGSTLGLLGGLIIAAIWIVWRARGHSEWRTLYRASLGTLIAIAVIVLGFFGLKNTSFVQHEPTLQRFASISLSDPTTQSRLIIWHMAWEGFLQKPVQGWGQENFNFVFNKYYDPSMYNQEQWFDRAHNSFLDWLIAGGLPAFLLYVSLFVLTGWAIIRSELSVPEQAVLLGLLAGYAFNNLFVFDNIGSYIYFFLLIAFAQGLFSLKPQSLTWSRPASNQTLAIAAPIVVILIGFGIWTINVPGIARAEGILNALMTVTPTQTATGVQGAPKDPSVNLTEFTQLLAAPVWPGTALGRQEIVEQMLQFASNNIAPSQTVSPALKQQFFIATYNAAASLMTQRQHDARLELFMGSFLDTFGQFQEAQKYLAQALVDSPAKQTILFETGISLINSGNGAQALPYLQKAFTEDQSYTDARILYAAGLYYTGQQAAGDAILTQGFGTVLVDDPRLLQVYINTKQYSRVIGIWQMRVQKSPDDAQAHIGLASAYFVSGNKAQAIAELQKAAQLDPSLAQQIQATITGIQNGTIK